MKNRSKVIGLSIFAVWIIVAAIGAYLIKWAPDSVSDGAAGIRIFGITVGPAAFVGFLIVVAILIAAVCIRLFAAFIGGYIGGYILVVVANILSYGIPIMGITILYLIWKPIDWLRGRD